MVRAHGAAKEKQFPLIIGSELKLRGTLDLSQVGQPTLTPQKTDAAGGGRRERP